MDPEKNKTEKIIDSTGELVEAYRSLITLKIVEQVSLSLSIGITGMLSLIVVLFIVLFAGLGAARWLGEYLDNLTLGYFIVGGFYLIVLGILALISKRTLVPWVRNHIIKNIYESHS